MTKEIKVDNWIHDGGENLHSSRLWYDHRYVIYLELELDGDSTTGWFIRVGCMSSMCIVEDYEHDLDKAKNKAEIIAHKLADQLFEKKLKINEMDLVNLELNYFNL